MEIKKIKKMIELLKTSEIGEIEVHEGDNSVRISQISQHVSSVSPAFFNTMASQSITTEKADVHAKKTVDQNNEISGDVATSPMVGKFYQASSPDKPPYVQVGSKVKKGEILCIVEAMKMMNPIESEVSGTIKTIFVKDGDPVEFGQNLFEIETN